MIRQLSKYHLTKNTKELKSTKAIRIAYVLTTFSLMVKIYGFILNRKETDLND